jgi:ankyrin repeat protein
MSEHHKEGKKSKSKAPKEKKEKKSKSKKHHHHRSTTTSAAASTSASTAASASTHQPLASGSEDWLELHRLAWRNDIDGLTALLKTDQSQYINHLDHRGNAPLHIAAHFNHQQIGLSTCATVSAYNINLCTPPCHVSLL